MAGVVGGAGEGFLVFRTLPLGQYDILSCTHLPRVPGRSIHGCRTVFTVSMGHQSRLLA